MRRILLPVLCAASLAAACGDEASGPGTVDATDTGAGDTSGGDSGGGDTTTPLDTGTPQDTTPQDTTPQDTTPQDTTPQDTTPQDTTPGEIVDEGEGNCLGILACAVQCTTQQCLTTCLGKADNDAEAAFFQGYLGCLDENSCIPEVEAGSQPTDEQVIESIECEQEHCIAANAECTTGAVYGAGTCTSIFACLSDCPSNTDVLCQRECFSGGTEEAVTAWFDLNYCLNIECYTADSFQTCAQQAIQNPPCSLKYNECAGDAGSGEGAGGGGGFSPERRDMDAFYKSMRGGR